jgi:predicted MFS family arabinose efflux permease
VLPFLALYLTSRRGFTTFGAGAVVALYGVGSGLGSFLGGKLTDRFGERRVQIASLVLAGHGFLVLGRLRAPLLIYATAFLLAVVNEAFRPANGAAFAAAVPPERLTQALGVRRLALNLGMTFGPALGGFLAARDYAWLFVVDGGTSIAAAVVLAFFDRSAPHAPALAHERAVVSPWRDAPFLALLALAFGHATILYQFFSTYPLALHELHGLREPQIGSVYAINTVLIIVCEMLLLRRLSGRGPLAVAAWGCFLFALGFTLLPLGRGYAWVAMTVVVWTFGEMLSMPFLETVAAQRGGARSRGSYLGAYHTAYSLAFASAPLLGAWIYQRRGAVVLFGGCGLVGAALFVGLTVLSRRFGPGPAPSSPVALEPPAVALAPPTP